MTDVFISYSRKDKAFVQRLHEALRGIDRDVWVDWQDIPLTADWWNEICTGIEAANTFVCVISPDSVRSKVCRDEVEYAVSHKKRFIPILYRDITEKADRELTPHAINTHNWIFFRETDDFDKAFVALTSAIDTDLNHVKGHTRLLVRAMDWERRGHDNSLLVRGSELVEAERWLGTGLGKEPHPTDLHTEYILTSRRVEERRQRVVFIGVMVALVVAVALTILSVILARQSEERRVLADNNAATATFAQGEALFNAATSDANAVIAHNNAVTATLAQGEALDNAATAVANAATATVAQGQALFNAATATLAQGEALDNAATAVANAATATVAQGLALNNEATAVVAQSVAERSADEAHSFALASSALLELNGANNDLAILLALEANQIENPPLLAQRSLAEAAFAPGTRRRCPIADGIIRDADFNTDGSRIVVSSWDGQNVVGKLDVWEVATCTRLAQAELPNALFTAVAYAPNGRDVLLATGSSDAQLKAINLWNTESGNIVYSVADNPSAIAFNIVFNADGSKALITYENAPSVVWDVEAGRAISQSEQAFFGGTFMPDGEAILSYSLKDVVLWEVATGKTLRPFQPYDFDIASVAVSPDGKTALTGAHDNMLILWDVASGTPSRLFSGHSEEIISVAYVGDRALSTSVDNSLRMWDINTGRQLLRLDGHSDQVREVIVLPDARTAFTWSWDKTARQWDIENAAQKLRLEGHSGGVNAIAFSKDGQFVVSGDENGGLILWDVTSGTRVMNFEGHSGLLNRIVFSPDGSKFVSADDGLFLWDYERREMIRQFEGNSGFVTSASFSPDGKLLAAGSGDSNSFLGEVLLWDVESGELIRRFTTEGMSFTMGVSFTPDGQFIVSGEYFNGIYLWNAADGTLVRRFNGHSGSIWALQVSVDGRTLLSGSYDNTARLWDIETGTEIRRFEGHSAPVFGASFSADGKYVLTNSGDSSVRLWDIASGLEVNRITYTSAVWSSAISPDGRSVVFGAEDGDVLLWDISQTGDVDTLIEWTHQNRYLRDLTCNERLAYQIAPLCETTES
jgi:WD40 repeat protein